MLAAVKSIVWISEPLASALCKVLSSETTIVTSASEFLAATRDRNRVSFIDSSALAEIDRSPADFGVRDGESEPLGPVIAICDGTLQTAVGWLPSHPWLSHVMSSAMLNHPLATEHLANVMTSMTKTRRPRLLDWGGTALAGRRVRIAHAAKRVERLERMGEFFESNGVGGRTVQLLRDAAEELLTNAFYDAPVSAGAVQQPISRTQDVMLPDDSACNMVYGCRDDLAIVRVQDPFGSLSRTRLVEVLTRCARTDMQVEVDETMGGAGLGLWRVFSAATFVAISVVNNRHTEFLVGIGKRLPGPRPFAFHLFFKEGRPRRWRVDDRKSVSESITIVAEQERSS